MRKTLHLDANTPSDLTLAAGLLRTGKLVAFPTETVYGLGASALDPTAVAAIFDAKQRPAWDPLIVHIHSLAQLAEITEITGELAARVSQLASHFWPGPLTLLLPRSAAIPEAVTAGRSLVGIRIPSHPAALALLTAAGIPIAAPSANRFGHTSPTTAAHVFADLDTRIDAVLDAGPTTIGLESTVLDPTQTPMVLYRPGAILPEQLTAATGIAVTLFDPPASAAEPTALPSPGVGIRHYAPHARLLLAEGGEAGLYAAIQPLLRLNPTNLGVLMPTNWHLQADVEIQPWAHWDDSEALAASLFSSLRALDDRQVNLIVCPMPDPGGLRDALRDRLAKAARPE